MAKYKYNKHKEISPLIKAAKKLKNKSVLATLFNLSRWLRQQKYLDLRHKRAKYQKLFRQRSAEQIIKNGRFLGCSDYALVAVALLKTLKIPCRLVQVINKDWLSDKKVKIIGHVLVEVYLDKKWHVLEPTKGIIGLDYASFNYVVYKKGANFQDIGIQNLKELRRKLSQFKKKWKEKTKKAKK